MQGASSLLVVLAIYLSAIWGWLNSDDAIALSFTTLVVSNVSLILVNRSWTKSIVESPQDISCVDQRIDHNRLTNVALACRFPLPYQNALRPRSSMFR
jgi:Ca2+-transporting ATPase